MDALSDVLRAIRLTGAVFLDAELRAGWSYLTPPPRLIGELHMPEAEHIIPYHLITEGRCLAKLVDGEPVQLETGDLVVFPHGDQHVLASSNMGHLRPVEMTVESLISSYARARSRQCAAAIGVKLRGWFVAILPATDGFPSPSSPACRGC